MSPAESMFASVIATLRMDPEWLAAELRASGLEARRDAGVRGMTGGVARKP